MSSALSARHRYDAETRFPASAGAPRRPTTTTDVAPLRAGRNYAGFARGPLRSNRPSPAGRARPVHADLPPICMSIWIRPAAAASRQTSYDVSGDCPTDGTRGKPRQFPSAVVTFTGRNECTQRNRCSAARAVKFSLARFDWNHAANTLRFSFSTSAFDSAATVSVKSVPCGPVLKLDRSGTSDVTPVFLAPMQQNAPRFFSSVEFISVTPNQSDSIFGTERY